MFKNIGVIGGSACSEEICKLAYRVGYLIGERGAVVVSGGMGGIMLHACHGAKDAGGITVGILPHGKEDANKYIDIAIPTYYGLARNHIVVRASDVLIAIDGYTGTLSEISFALNEGKTVIALKSWNIDRKKLNRGEYVEVPTADEAVEQAFERIL